MIMDNASDWELEILANAVYEAGLCPPHYPVPALADTTMVLSLCHPQPNAGAWRAFAWDGIWRTQEELGYLA